MQVSELREAMRDLEDDAEVFGVEYGHRSSALLTLERATVFEDDREEDDWGHEKEPKGESLYILVGGVGGNRYPPSGLRDELEW